MLGITVHLKIAGPFLSQISTFDGQKKHLRWRQQSYISDPLVGVLKVQGLENVQKLHPARLRDVVHGQGSTRVAIAVQVVGSHPLLTRAVENLLAHLKDFPVEILPPASNEAQAMGPGNSPRLFLLDACSLQTDLGRLAQKCRGQAPGSKFLALLPPENGSHEEMLRLFFWGIEGFVELHKMWQQELPHAMRSILEGKVWVPRAVLAAYIAQMRALLDKQLVPGNSLTVREGQVLQLLMRRLANKEISSALGISERTVKYHVSNILSKLQLEDRRGLSADKLALKPLT